MRANALGPALVAALASGLGGCAATAPAPPAESVTIPYDPYNYDPDELIAAAQSQCEAFGLTAVYVDETIDPNSVRWRYRHFDCV